MKTSFIGGINLSIFKSSDNAKNFPEMGGGLNGPYEGGLGGCGLEYTLYPL